MSLRVDIDHQTPLILYSWYTGCMIYNFCILSYVNKLSMQIIKMAFVFFTGYRLNSEWNFFKGFEIAKYCLFLENGEEAEWVDLLLNPEQYTGYQGKGANRIWTSIYQENCFLPHKNLNNYDDFEKSFLSKTCLEKRVFYRTLSGLHASISIHLSYKYLMPGSFSKPTFAPNFDEFKKRFDAELTNGNGRLW